MVNHPTTNISKFVDDHIKDYVPNTKSHIRDTLKFISKITTLGPIPEGAILATLDVTSLYTNIPKQEGLVVVAEHMRKDPSKGPTANFILDLLKLVLHNMYFELTIILLTNRRDCYGYSSGTKLCQLIYG